MVMLKDLNKRRKEYVFSEDSKLKAARFGDLRGVPHIVKDIQRFITFLQNYQKFKEGGVRTPQGILLCGRPGTGKTLTARVIATESGARLIDAGSFPRLDGSWTAEDIVSLFALAREYHAHTKKPVILYFDEISVICSSEIDDMYHSYRSERRQPTDASAALASQLDGIAGKPEGIFVIAATNLDPDELDSALLRAGRLGHHIHYRPPTGSGRVEILKYYLNKKQADGINAEELAKVMPEDTTPAEIEELVEQACMEAWLDSTNPKEAKLTDEYLIKQLLRDILGSSTETWDNEHDRYTACVHEAGHVITGVRLWRIGKLVIVPKNGYREGKTIFDSRDRALTSDDMEEDITIAYGGGAAEELIFGERLLGGNEDVGDATELSIELVAHWGKTTNYIDWGPCPRGRDSLIHPLDDGERSSVYAKARRIRDRCYRQAKEILKDFGKRRIEHVAKQISEREFLLGNDLERVVLEAGEQ